ncbi:hypothetical protein [Streptomyces sp. NPDC049949]|uniref:hypothetical protein n=1 Tax=Streptomyces sp. NPDC049949 TaxID=3154627 RepID=UPI003445ECA2
MDDETGGIRVGAFGTAIFGLVLFGLSGLAAARAVRTLRRGADLPRSEHWEALQTLAMALWLGLLVPAFALLMTGLVPSLVSVCLVFLPAFAMGICWVAGKWVRHQERIAVERAQRDLQLPMARRMWQPTTVCCVWIALALAVSVVLLATATLRNALNAHHGNASSPRFDDAAMTRLLDGPVTTIMILAIVLGLAHGTWQAIRLSRENNRLLNARQDVIGGQDAPAKGDGEPPN